MVRRRFATAEDNGRSYAISQFGSDALPEEVILQAMAENPYKGEQARKDFVEGVSKYVNASMARRNRRMNES